MVFWLAYSSVSLPSVARYAYTNQEKEHRNNIHGAKVLLLQHICKYFCKYLEHLTKQVPNAKNC